MRTLKLWTEFLTWRWAPTIGLLLVAFIYVALAVFTIPDRLGLSGQPGSSGGSLDRVRKRPAPFAATLSINANSGELSPSTDPPMANLATFEPVGHRAESDSFPKRGFTPPLARVDPPPEAPPVAAPPPPLPPPARIEVPLAPAAVPPAAPRIAETVPPAAAAAEVPSRAPEVVTTEASASPPVQAQPAPGQ